MVTFAQFLSITWFTYLQVSLIKTKFHWFSVIQVPNTIMTVHGDIKLTQIVIQTHSHADHVTSGMVLVLCQVKSSSSQSTRQVLSSSLSSRARSLALVYTCLEPLQQQRQLPQWLGLDCSSNSISAKLFCIAMGKLHHGSFDASVVMNCFMWSSRASEMELTISFAVIFRLLNPCSFPNRDSGDWETNQFSRDCTLSVHKF